MIVVKCEKCGKDLPENLDYCQMCKISELKESHYVTNIEPTIEKLKTEKRKARIYYLIMTFVVGFFSFLFLIITALSGAHRITTSSYTLYTLFIFFTIMTLYYFVQIFVCGSKKKSIIIVIIIITIFYLLQKISGNV